ncbi:MAG: cytochrome P450 [Xanthomonadales bacterium]|nr:cytochrome P450 [Xanthomonadales bacterium]
MKAPGSKYSPLYSAEDFFDFSDLDQFCAGHPYTAYERLRKEAPIYWQSVEPPGRGYWILSRYSDIQYVSRNPQLFVSGQGFKASDDSYERMGLDIDSAMRRILLATDGAEHADFRQILQPYFSLKTAKSMEADMRKYVTGILDRLDGKKSIDAVRDVAIELPILVLCNILGVPESDQSRILNWTNRMVGVDDPDFNASPQQAAAAFREVFDYGRELVRDRQLNPQNDLISLVANAKINGKPLEASQTDGFFVLMVGAGNETSRNSITGSLHALSLFPEMRRKLVENSDGIKTSVEELLRHISPVIHMRRTAADDVVISGQKIAAGEKVVLLYGSANRDPEVFPEPNKLDFQRSNANSQIAFGHGIHLCLGAMFARMEVGIMLQEFLKRYADYELEAEPAYLRSHFVHGIKSMPIRLN